MPYCRELCILPTVMKSAGSITRGRSKKVDMEPQHGERESLTLNTGSAVDGIPPSMGWFPSSDHLGHAALHAAQLTVEVGLNRMDSSYKVLEQSCRWTSRMAARAIESLWMFSRGLASCYTKVRQLGFGVRSFGFRGKRGLGFREPKGECTGTFEDKRMCARFGEWAPGGL